MTNEATASRVKLGRYELLRPLATGGMAELHLARLVGPAGFEKTVVIKEVRAAFSSSPSFVDMFLDEARLAAQLRHPNIVQVLDLGRDGDRWYIVMEYLRGHDLWSIVSALGRRGERMPLAHAIAIVIGVCAGLHHAHELVDDEGRSREIVHRDVSPRNVVVTFDGDVKIVDFGIAKATHRRTETSSNELKGKLRYMAPEQCRREPVDRRADVFAVAAILWELTVGRRLFEGKTDDEVIDALRAGRIRAPSDVVPDYPIELERIVMRGLAFEREARWPTTQAMALALAAFASARDAEPVAFKLGDFLRALFGDVRETAAPRPDPHAIETRVPVGRRVWPRRAQLWLLVGALAAFVAVLAARRGPPAPARPPSPRSSPSAPSPSSPSPSVPSPSAPLSSSSSSSLRPLVDERVRPPAPAVAPPAVVCPRTAEAPMPARATHHHTRHRPPRAGHRSLSDNLDALME